MQGETVTLILETSDPKQSLDADLSGLESDFAVLDRRSETQMSIVNGRQSAEVRTMIVLEPKRSGRSENSGPFCRWQCDTAPGNPR